MRPVTPGAGVGISPELRVMFAPQHTYRELVREPAVEGFMTAVRRPAVVALVTATALSIAATGILPARLLLSTMVCWSFAPLVQLLAAVALIGSSSRREVAMTRGIDLLFAGHGPWSIWLLVFAAGAAWGPGELVSMTMWCSLPVPMIWTAWILRAFCQAVLNESPRGAAARIVLHQGIVWSIAAFYIIAAISWPRLIPFLQR